MKDPNWPQYTGVRDPAGASKVTDAVVFTQETLQACAEMLVVRKGFQICEGAEYRMVCPGRVDERYIMHQGRWELMDRRPIG